MQQKKRKEKSIAERVNANNFIPNVSLGCFSFGTNIKRYLNNHTFIYLKNPNRSEGYGFDTYNFEKLNLEVWTDDKGVIQCVRSENDCFWNNVNMIGLRYVKFKEIFNAQPDSEDICFFPDGTSQHVYDFDSIGLQLWVRYGIIRTVIAGKIVDD